MFLCIKLARFSFAQNLLDFSEILPDAIQECLNVIVFYFRKQEHFFITAKTRVFWPIRLNAETLENDFSSAKICRTS